MYVVSFFQNIFIYSLIVSTKELLVLVRLYGLTRIELRLQEANINFFFSDVSEFTEAQHMA